MEVDNVNIIYCKYASDVVFLFNLKIIIISTGILVAAKTAHVAFDEIYYLERACMNQILVSYIF